MIRAVMLKSDAGDLLAKVIIERAIGLGEFLALRASDENGVIDTKRRSTLKGSHKKSP
jgi:hypothetical protein